MKRFSEQLYKKAETVQLRAAEKRALRERGVSYMEDHPLSAAQKAQKIITEPALLTESYRIIRIPFNVLARYTAVAAAVVLIVVPFVAERAMPGDALYAIKVSFNEEVRSTLVFDTYQKVEWETERLNRRISEARLLADEGRLTEEVEIAVAEAVREHAENAQKGIEELRMHDADEAMLASIALDTTLEVQSTSLRGNDNDMVATMMMKVTDSAPSDEGQSMSFLANVLDESLSRHVAPPVASSTVSFDKLMARIEQNTTRAYELLETIKETASTEEVSDVSRRIEDIERSIAEAIKVQSTDSYAARTLLIDSLQRVQRLIVFMNDIQVRANVDLETIVPVVLTADEKLSMLRGWETSLTEQLYLVEGALEEETDLDVIAKAEDGLAQIAEMRTGIEATPAEEFEALQTQYEGALALVSDLIALFTIEIPFPEVTIEASTTATSTASTTVEIIEDNSGSTTEAGV